MELTDAMPGGANALSTTAANLLERETQPRRIVGLDGLRAISIILVIIGHAWATIPRGETFSGLAAYLGNHNLGVETFFVISGYLIT